MIDYRCMDCEESETLGGTLPMKACPLVRFHAESC
ncbi:hypothetical protein B0G66_12211 [Bacillus badius]|nr:hypothetical protein B0G66_12211 [Bacillus badius]